MKLGLIAYGGEQDFPKAKEKGLDFVEFCLKKIIFLSDHPERSVNLMQVTLWLFQKVLCTFKGRQLRAGCDDSGINKHGKDVIQVVIKFIFFRDGITNLIGSKRVADILEKQISNVAGTADIFINKHGRGIFEKNSLL